MKQEWTPSETRQWIIDQGFVSTPEGWMAEEIDLAALAQGEWRLIRRMS